MMYWECWEDGGVDNMSIRFIYPCVVCSWELAHEKEGLSSMHVELVAKRIK